MQIDALSWEWRFKHRQVHQECWKQTTQKMGHLGIFQKSQCNLFLTEASLILVGIVWLHQHVAVWDVLFCFHLTHTICVEHKSRMKKKFAFTMKSQFLSWKLCWHHRENLLNHHFILLLYTVGLLSSAPNTQHPGKRFIFNCAMSALDGIGTLHENLTSSLSWKSQDERELDWSFNTAHLLWDTKAATLCLDSQSKHTSEHEEARNNAQHT
jgi:hypothetical protein